MNRRALVSLTIVLSLGAVIGCQREPGSLRFEGRKPSAETEPPSALEQRRAQVIGLLQETAKDSLVQGALRSANAVEPKPTAAEIIELEELWRNSSADSELVTSLIETSCGQLLRDLQRRETDIIEILVTGSSGQNVCQTAKTSTYFQGNEAWWRKAMENRLPTHGQIEYDRSSEMVGAPVYVPVRDILSGEVIGLAKAVIRQPSSVK